jgi:predicted nucleic acid-binding Zn ribbon protein
MAKIFLIFFFLILAQSIFALNYGEGNYSNNFYGTGYYVNPEDNTVGGALENVPASSGGYAPQTYYTDEFFQSKGNNFRLRYNDKINFVVNFTNHTLTINNFNSTIARVSIQSKPITAYLEKGILYEFDLNNNSVKDVRVRYDGMNNTKAMIFIREIVHPKDNNIKSENEQESFNNPQPKFKSAKSSMYIALALVIAIFVIILFFVLHRNRRKKKYRHKIH